MLCINLVIHSSFHWFIYYFVCPWFLSFIFAHLCNISIISGSILILFHLPLHYFIYPFTSSLTRSFLHSLVPLPIYSMRSSSVQLPALFSFICSFHLSIRSFVCLHISWFIHDFLLWKSCIASVDFVCSCQASSDFNKIAFPLLLGWQATDRLESASRWRIESPGALGHVRGQAGKVHADWQVPSWNWHPILLLDSRWQLYLHWNCWCGRSHIPAGMRWGIEEGATRGLQRDKNRHWCWTVQELKARDEKLQVKG